jgi:hydrogenase-4 component F
MFHVMNHSLCKSLGFFSAGRLGQLYGTHDMTRLTGAARLAPVWGRGFFLSLLALIGVAPFAIFMSEFQILKAAADGGQFIVMVAFLAGAGIVFVGALKHAISAAWGAPTQQPQPAPQRAGLTEKALVVLPLGVLLVLGVWMPPLLRDVLNRVADIIRGGL